MNTFESSSFVVYSLEYRYWVYSEARSKIRILSSSEASDSSTCRALFSPLASATASFRPSPDKCEAIYLIMLERDGRAVAGLRAQARALGATSVEVRQMDALAFLAGAGENFDLILLDPPFDGDSLMPALQRAATRLNPGGKIYAESPAPLVATGYEILRQGRAGLSNFCLLEPVCNA